MTVSTRNHALRILRRAYGPDYAQDLPDRMDLDKPADAELLFRLGLSPDRLVDALGGEI